MPDLEIHWLPERMAFLDRSLTGDSVWGQKVKKAFRRLKFNPKAESYQRPSGEALFFAEWRKALRNLPVSSDLLRSTKELHWELAVDTASDPLEELGARFGLLEQLAAHSERVAPHRLGFQGGLDRYARLCSLQQCSGRNGFACLLLLRPGPPDWESRRGVDGTH